MCNCKHCEKEEENESYLGNHTFLLHLLVLVIHLRSKPDNNCVARHAFPDPFFKLPENVFRVYLGCKALLSRFAQSKVVDEAAVAAPRVP